MAIKAACLCYLVVYDEDVRHAEEAERKVAEVAELLGEREEKHNLENQLS